MENLGNRWQINSVLIAKIDLMFLITDLQVVINRLDFFQIIGFDWVTHPTKLFGEVE